MYRFAFELYRGPGAGNRLRPDGKLLLLPVTSWVCRSVPGFIVEPALRDW